MVDTGLVATEFALERENLGGLLPSETKKQFKKVLDLKAGIHSSCGHCSAVLAGLNLTRTAEVRIICSP